MSIWDLYKRPASVKGEKVPGLNAVYYTGLEGLTQPATTSAEYIATMGFIYFTALATYVYCTKTGRRSQRLFSSLTLAGVPFVWFLHMKGDDSTPGLTHQISLEQRLDFYPMTRRALERAITDVSQKPPN